MTLFKTTIASFVALLRNSGLAVQQKGKNLFISSGKVGLNYKIIATAYTMQEGLMPLRLDYILSSPEKLCAGILSQCKLNKVIYARQCTIDKVNKQKATEFLNTYHLMNATKSAFQFGLFFKGELMAVATFSKGRKMNRLNEQERSFELIRFCTKYGHTVAGGLTKLLAHFVREKKAGDIMTYIDTSSFAGGAYLNAGFRIHSRTSPITLLVEKSTGLNKVWHGEEFDSKFYFLFKNNGNLKLVLSATKIAS